MSSTAVSYIDVAEVFSIPPAEKLCTITWAYLAQGYGSSIRVSNFRIIAPVRPYVCSTLRPCPIGAYTGIARRESPISTTSNFPTTIVTR